MVATREFNYSPLRAFKILNKALRIQGKIGVVELESIVLFALINKKLNGTSYQTKNPKNTKKILELIND